MFLSLILSDAMPSADDSRHHHIAVPVNSRVFLPISLVDQKRYTVFLNFKNLALHQYVFGLDFP